MKTLVILGVLGLAFLGLYRLLEGQSAQPLLQGEVQVPAGKLFLIPFNVTEAGFVRGEFHSSGARGNDIQAIIADADNFENWRSGHAAVLVYQSPQTTAGSLNVLIRPGNYFLVLNNQFSIVSAKTVTGDISVFH